MSGPEGNGHLPDPDDDDADDDAPLDAAEAAQGAAAADEVSDQTLDECVVSVIEELEGVTRERDGESVAYAVGGRVFAVLMPDLLDARANACGSRSPTRASAFRLTLNRPCLTASSRPTAPSTVGSAARGWASP